MFVISVVTILVAIVSIYGIYSFTSNPRPTKTVSSNNTEERASVEIYKEDTMQSAKNEQNSSITEDNFNNIIDNSISIENDKKDEYQGINITALGEIMMGGNSWSNNSYALAFKNIASYTTEADYTVSSLATNITSVKDLSDTKTKYIANESIANSFSALGIDALNIATDHMLDFSQNMFINTIDVLRKNDIDIIGLENDIAYAEKNGVRVAFIGVNNVVIGNTRNYIDAGMYIYDLNKIKNSIKEAKTKADTVIVMTHYGKENTHQVTDVMRWFAREIINSGADMVLGGHSLGIYPVEEYKGKIIIYSLGYLIHDTNNEYGKKSAIFNFDINLEGTIEKIDITPTYIENKTTVKLYKDVSDTANKDFLNELKNNSNLEKYASNIEDDKLVIKLNK